MRKCNGKTRRGGSNVQGESIGKIIHIGVQYNGEVFVEKTKREEYEANRLKHDIGDPERRNRDIKARRGQIELHTATMRNTLGD